MEALNYASQAIEDISSRLAVDVDFSLPPGDRVLHEAVACWLRRAVKFLLPDNGDLLGMRETFAPLPLLVVRPPFPVSVLEYQSVMGEHDLRDPSAVFFPARRLVLVLDCSDERVFAEVDQAFEGGARGVSSDGMLILPINDCSRSGQEGLSVNWVINWFAVFFPYGQEGEESTLDEIVAEGNAGWLAVNKGIVPKKREMSLQRYRWNPVLSGVMGRMVSQRFASPGERSEAFDLDATNEVRATIEMCVALACSNVSSSAALPAPEKLNKKRLKKGREPLFEYHVLSVDTHAANSAGGGAGEGGGSVRPHLRRGHIRRLRDDKIVWVNMAMVNAAKKGFVAKDYRVN